MINYKYYERDEIWRIWGINSKEDFIAKFVPKVGLSKLVPEVVLNQYETVTYLISSSYFHYKLLDEALNKSLFTIELALKLRYKELKGIEWKEVKFSKNDKNPTRKSKAATRKTNNLETLIEELVKLDVFSGPIDYLHMIRSLRNFAAHQDGKRLFGYFSLRILDIITLILNELYEEPSQRKLRDAKLKEINSDLNEFVNGNLIAYSRESNKFIPVFKIKCLFVNDLENVYFVQVVPIFDLNLYEGKDFHGALPMIFDEIRDFDIDREKNIIRGIPPNMTELIEIVNPKKIQVVNALYGTWVERYNKLEQKYILEMNLNSRCHDEYIKIKLEFLTSKEN